MKSAVIVVSVVGGHLRVSGRPNLSPSKKAYDKYYNSQNSTYGRGNLDVMSFAEPTRSEADSGKGGKVESIWNSLMVISVQKGY